MNPELTLHLTTCSQCGSQIDALCRTGYRLLFASMMDAEPTLPRQSTEELNPPQPARAAAGDYL